MDTPVFHRTKDIRPDVGSSSLGNPFLSVSKGKDKETEDRTAEKPPEGIYSPRIRLEYRPPIALPAPFPRILSVEGTPECDVCTAHEMTSVTRSASLHRLNDFHAAYNECTVF